LFKLNLDQKHEVFHAQKNNPHSRLLDMRKVSTADLVIKHLEKANGDAFMVEEDDISCHIYIVFIEGKKMIFGIIAVFVPIQLPYRPVVLICPRCQTRISVSSKFCPECGADLRPKQLSNQKRN